MTLTGDATPQDPAELACPVVRCRRAGARYVVLFEHWQFAPCAEHADEIEADPSAWRIVDGQPGVLKIAKAGTDLSDGGSS